MNVVYKLKNQDQFTKLYSFPKITNSIHQASNGVIREDMLGIIGALGAKLNLQFTHTVVKSNLLHTLLNYVPLSKDRISPNYRFPSCAT